MPLPRIVAEAFGGLTISLVCVFVIFGLLCIIYSVYFRLQIQRQGYRQLGYFNGPWITRIAFVLVAIWWACGEIVRLTLLKGKGKVFTTESWQKDICKYYIISNLGFAEPCFLLILVFLLHAAGRKDCGALSQRWNIKIIAYVFLICIPMFAMQLVLVLIGPKFNNEKSNGMKIRKYFTSMYSMHEDRIACTYPLLSTIVLGLFNSLLLTYLSCLGYRMASIAINKGLQRRINILLVSVISLILLRVCVLGLTVLPQPGGLAFEALVFLAFLLLLLCALVAVCILVFYPVYDAMDLRGRHGEIEEIPFDDYYDGASSLVVNQSRLETGRNSDASTKRGSISFRTMIKDDALPSTDGLEETGLFSPGHLRIASPAASPLFPGRPLIPLHGVP